MSHPITFTQYSRALKEGSGWKSIDPLNPENQGTVTVGRDDREGGSRWDPVEIVEAAERLEAWDGYLVRRWENGRAITDGTVILYFACTSVSAPTQVAAYQRLLEEQWDIGDAIVKHLRENFDTLKEEYYLDPDDNSGVPRITEFNEHDFDLRPFIGPRSVSITEHEKDGIPYLEWSLNCTWDEEHGLAAVTHGNRVIDLARGETDIYKIFADNGTLEQELKEAKKYVGMRGTKRQKAWWHFW